MTATLGLLQALITRQKALEKILIDKGITTDEELEIFSLHYLDDFNEIIGKVKDEFGNIISYSFFSSLKSEIQNDETTSDTKPKEE